MTISIREAESHLSMIKALIRRRRRGDDLGLAGSLRRLDLYRSISSQDVYLGVHESSHVVPYVLAESMFPGVIQLQSLELVIDPKYWAVQKDVHYVRGAEKFIWFVDVWSQAGPTIWLMPPSGKDMINMVYGTNMIMRAGMSPSELSSIIELVLHNTVSDGMMRMTLELGRALADQAARHVVEGRRVVVPLSLENIRSFVRRNAMFTRWSEYIYRTLLRWFSNELALQATYEGT